MVDAVVRMTLAGREVACHGENQGQRQYVVDRQHLAGILDRLLHHSHVITIRGVSYRLKEKRRSGLVRPSTVAGAS